MAADKEKNFVSAVVYLHNEKDQVVDFFQQLDRSLSEHFQYYELIAVNDGCDDGTEEILKKWAQQNLSAPLTILNMSLRQGLEPAMNAGQDAAIGDFVFEFDSIRTKFDPALIWQAYQKSLTGFDVVSVCPNHMRLSSRMFYWLFNRFSNSRYELETDVFRLVSRRAINRVHAISSNLAYRKAAYAASGLACASIHFDGKAVLEEDARVDKAMDSLALYTNAGYKISLAISVVMMVLTMVALVYTIVIWWTGDPIPGWTTTMLVLSAGFSGVFFILTMAVKYLNLLVQLVFKKQNYLIEEIEKLQK